MPLLALKAKTEYRGGGGADKVVDASLHWTQMIDCCGSFGHPNNFQK